MPKPDRGLSWHSLQLITISCAAEACSKVFEPVGHDIAQLTMGTKTDSNSKKPQVPKRPHWSAPEIRSEVVPLLNDFWRLGTPKNLGSLENSIAIKLLRQSYWHKDARVIYSRWEQMMQQYSNWARKTKNLTYRHFNLWLNFFCCGTHWLKIRWGWGADHSRFSFPCT